MAEVATKQFKAVLIGGTGATGKYLFAELLKAQEFSEIVLLGRRKVALPDDVENINLEEEEKSGRVKQEIVDLESITVESVGEHFRDTDVFFSCLGTTRRAAGSAENFRHIDYGYNYNFAKVAKESGVRLFTLMSSQGANKDSYFLYLNSKGKLENDCGAFEFPQYSIFRPGFLDRKGTKRFMERITAYFIRRIDVSTVARAMCANSIQHLSSPIPETPKQYIYFNDQISHMSETYDLSKQDEKDS